MPKYAALYLTPPTLLEILASFLVNILPFLTKLHLSPKPVTTTFVNFAVFGCTSICLLPVPLLCHSLKTCNSLYYKLPKFQLFCLQQIQNSCYLFDLPACVKALKSCHITAIVCYLHWLKITEHVEYKLLSLTYKVFTASPPPYLYNLMSVQCPHCTRSSSIVTVAHRYHAL